MTPGWMCMGRPQVRDPVTNLQGSPTGGRTACGVVKVQLCASAGCSWPLRGLALGLARKTGVRGAWTCWLEVAVHLVYINNGRGAL